MKDMRLIATDKPIGALVVYPSMGRPGDMYFRTGQAHYGACISRRDVRRLHRALGAWLAKPAKKAGKR